MDPLLPINKVFSMILQHERQFVPHNAGLDVEDSKVLVNASDSRRSQGRGRSGSNGQSGSFRKKSCTYCGKDNHVVDNCFKKHGFPPNFGRNNTSANHVGIDELMDNDDTKSLKASEPFTFTKSQYENLVNLLQSNAGSSTQVNGASTSNLTNTFVPPKSVTIFAPL
ncbi:retrovirus-related pol polyprotein from transposon TNT 1-94 [Trifolium medium]|uniref:Retrovirus-related pol polyprotein from transposon TNT 1-94 n=1 Tax=Trifolium medium TaxID=97028 RepID=A0A392PNQ3_9FABA|nr:retrovirus-related pol polyprotein from transposon TNT 1-94 [Trifolium medium]